MIKSYKKMAIIALVFIVSLTLITTTYAISDTSRYQVSASSAPNAGSTFAMISGKVLGVITVAGILVAVGGMMILGIQFMRGSVEEKATYKQKLVPFIVGFFILVTAVTIVKIASQINWQ